MGGYHQNKTMRLELSKQQVWEAYRKVKANQGTYGVDEVDWKQFDARLKQNLYTLWNRLSSGSYYPKAVRRVSIPKSNGGKRGLGIPTLSDRIAQEVLRSVLAPYVEPHFHADSYAYQSGKNAHDAIGQCRYRTNYYSWLIDLDIKGYFDNIPHDKLMQAVKHYCPIKWMWIYIERILQAPVQMEDGQLHPTLKGVPQGGVVSPLLANLYLHVVFDGWIGKAVRRKLDFERYADDIIIHCSSYSQTTFVLRSIAERFGACGLELHPEKTKIVCTELRKESREVGVRAETFEFLGYRFQPRWCVTKEKGEKLLYDAKVSPKAMQKMMQVLKQKKLHKRKQNIQALSKELNPILRGWINYYGVFGKVHLNKLYVHLNLRLVKWCKWNYRMHKLAAISWLKKKWHENPNLFAHWQQTKWFAIM
jgi:group II intron reverse transcriptase/maturase